MALFILSGARIEPAKTKLNLDGGLAQSEEHVVRNDEAPGSKPGFSTNEILFAPSWSSIVVTRLS